MHLQLQLSWRLAVSSMPAPVQIRSPHNDMIPLRRARALAVRRRLCNWLMSAVRRVVVALLHLHLLRHLLQGLRPLPSPLSCGLSASLSETITLRYCIMPHTLLHTSLFHAAVRLCRWTMSAGHT